MYAYRVAKYIGSYAVALRKVDAIIFTAGIGENSPSLRREICSYLKVLGVKLDLKKNRKEATGPMDISAPSSKIKILVIPTNEELMIAKESAKAVGALK